MIKNFTQEQFDSAKGTDHLELICKHCGKIFTKTKRSIKRIGNASCNMSYDFCSTSCMYSHNSKIREFKCITCGKPVLRRPCDIIGNIFCSRSCAATHNNIDRRMKRKKHICKSCGKEISKRSTYCKACYTSLTLINSNTKLEDIHNTAKYQVNARVRGLARSKAKHLGLDKKCQICGYDKHVEVHHIKPISSFPPDTLISDINSEDNLVVLCPNCHWEADNGLLKFD